MKKILPWAAAALALSLPVSTRQAQALELKVADSFPAGHYLVRLMLKPWMDDVTKRTNGAVTFTYYPNQQIGKAADMLRLTQSGVVDIGYIGPSYVSDKMPLSEVAQLPGAFETACQGTLAYWKTAREGVLAKQEYAPNKIKLLFEVVLPPYQVWTAKQKVDTTKDMGGLKLRTTGGAQDLTLRALGAVPVRKWLHPMPMNRCRAAQWTACCSRWRASLPMGSTSWSSTQRKASASAASSSPIRSTSRFGTSFRTT
ncbi:TRAP-type C4-dicarboxylate transport system substrate-binding protein [Bradyrhizobium sp. LM6.11]